MNPSVSDNALAEPEGTPTASRNPGRAWLALALVAALLLAGLSAWRQGWFTPTAHVYITLPSANGVQTGMPVKVKGFVIGEVDDIALLDSLNVRVRLRLATAKMALLGADAKAHFGRDGPIGGKFIEISPGARQGRRLAAEQELKLDAGTELEDVMATVKVAVEKLTLTLDKVNPILDDTRKLTGEASAMRETVRASLTASLAEIQAMSGQLRQTSERARTLVGHIDDDRAKVVADVRKVLAQAGAAATGVRNTLRHVETELPPSLKLARELLTNARDTSGDVKKMVGAARGDVPAIVQSGRSTAQDAAEITQGLKNTWPLSSAIKPPTSGQLPLSGDEGIGP
ncbi:MAG: MCE family protein [Hydrogenophilales bacterium]|nr:MCE family protein [Hydrogenophilales bacterium]